jgi:gliding motility-associated-like protein
LHYDLSHIKAQFKWQDGSTSPRYTITEPGKYWVEMTIGPDCRDSDTITVNYYDYKMNIKGDTLGCEGVPISLSSTVPETIWQDSLKGASLIVSQSGLYVARSKLAPCLPSDSVFVRFQPCTLSIPNIFSPNSDGINDTWMIDGLDRAVWQLSVFNRYGQQVFASDDYKGLWDGGSLPEGVYYYHLTSSQAKLEYRGWVVLQR